MRIIGNGNYLEITKVTKEDIGAIADADKARFLRKELTGLFSPCENLESEVIMKACFLNALDDAGNRIRDRGELGRALQEAIKTEGEVEDWQKDLEETRIIVKFDF